MTKEIYEKKHRFEAVIDAVYMLVGFGFVLFIMIMMPTFKNTAFESDKLLMCFGIEILFTVAFTLAAAFGKSSGLGKASSAVKTE